jgi:site-specific recombinase XerD
MGTRHDIRQELGQLCSRNRDDSHATQAARRDVLDQAARVLQKAGFRDLAVTSLKPKHVEVLLAQWRADKLADSTMKNRMSHLRWVGEKINKPNLCPKNNDVAGIGRRSFIGTETKAQKLDNDQLAKIGHERLKVSLELQQAFGLRREECMKIHPALAMERGGGDKVWMKDTWCKGGREREIPILNDYQRDVLSRAAALAGKGSMIPADKNYAQWLNTYENQTKRADMHVLHGLRHSYAQERFEAVAGFKSPLAGGPGRDQLTPEQKERDFEARMVVSNELGHNREEVTAVYLGR